MIIQPNPPPLKTSSMYKWDPLWTFTLIMCINDQNQNTKKEFSTPSQMANTCVALQSLLIKDKLSALTEFLLLSSSYSVSSVSSIQSHSIVQHVWSLQHPASFQFYFHFSFYLISILQNIPSILGKTKVWCVKIFKTTLTLLSLHILSDLLHIDTKWLFVE